MQPQKDYSQNLISNRATLEYFVFNPTTDRLSVIEMVTRKLEAMLWAHLLQLDKVPAMHICLLILLLTFTNFLSSFSFALIPSSILFFCNVRTFVSCLKSFAN